MNDIPQHDDLPLPDYDHLPVGVLGSKITGLDESGLQQLLAYERAHGDRLPVVQVLEHRLEALRQGGYYPWDYQPLKKASEQYMRNHMDLNILEESKRFPRGE